MDHKDLLRRGRVFLHSLLVSDRGDRLPPVRWTRQALNLVNDLAGRPLCSAAELARRAAELAEAEAAVAAQPAGAPAKAAPREAAPVLLYVTDQDVRTKKKIEDILKARDIPYRVNDVTDDEASRSWALMQAHKTEFPLLFIAAEPIGGLDEVMQLDVRGELRKKVYG